MILVLELNKFKETYANYLILAILYQKEIYCIQQVKVLHCLITQFPVLCTVNQAVKVVVCKTSLTGSTPVRYSKKISGDQFSLARTSALHAEGHRFESDIFHNNAHQLSWLERCIHIAQVIGSNPICATIVINLVTLSKPSKRNIKDVDEE